MLFPEMSPELYTYTVILPNGEQHTIDSHAPHHTILHRHDEMVDILIPPIVVHEPRAVFILREPFAAIVVNKKEDKVAVFEKQLMQLSVVLQNQGVVTLLLSSNFATYIRTLHTIMSPIVDARSNWIQSADRSMTVLFNPEAIEDIIISEQEVEHGNT